MNRRVGGDLQQEIVGILRKGRKGREGRNKKIQRGAGGERALHLRERGSYST